MADQITLYGIPNCDSVKKARKWLWRKLSEDQQSGLNQSKAIALMIENTSIIKRPVMQFGDQLLVGFDESTFEEHFS